MALHSMISNSTSTPSGMDKGAGSHTWLRPGRLRLLDGCGLRHGSMADVGSGSEVSSSSLSTHMVNAGSGMDICSGLSCFWTDTGASSHTWSDSAGFASRSVVSSGSGSLASVKRSGKRSGSTSEAGGVTGTRITNDWMMDGLGRLWLSGAVLLFHLANCEWPKGIINVLCQCVGGSSSSPLQKQIFKKLSLQDTRWLSFRKSSM